METNTAIHPRIKALSDLAYRAHYGTSFSPEKRRDQIIKDYSEELIEDLETVKKHGGDVARYEDKYISLLTAWLRAKSNCISPMITGPSNFPVRRAEKANQAEHNRSVEFSEWRKKALHAITKPENTTIVKGTDSAIDQMRAKIERLKKNGYRWSPKNATWQRQLTQNALYSLKFVLI